MEVRKFKHRKPMRKLLSEDKDELIKLAKEIMEDTEKGAKTGEELASTILGKKYGKEWYNILGAPRVAKRLGQRLCAFLGTTRHARNTRFENGIGIVRDKRPLRFYKKKFEPMVKKTQDDTEQAYLIKYQ